MLHTIFLLPSLQHPYRLLIDLIPRTLVGAAVVGVAASRAYRAGQLRLGAAYAAFFVGTAAVMGGVMWALSLAAFFYTSVTFSRWKAGEKRQRSLAVLPEERARNHWQVLANGGVFAACAVLWGTTGSWEAGLFGFGALATATADTWATEIGMALNATPRSLLTFEHVEPGTSGGISAFGLGAAVAGAFLIALLAVVSFTTPFDVPRLEAVLLGGLAGAMADSLLGATIQSKRWCDSCGKWTERRVHTCGFRSRHAKGFRWMDNDVVNVLATAIGGAVAVGAWNW
jgi:uncharacterized protein (TIGR00297 family)